ncbi:MAG: hypothetical protein JNM00_04340 [Flavobacteriales bacterium]|nr:hypothetical protein [Flavobacteriales bacterium]
MAEHNIPDGLMHEAYQLFEGGHTTDEIRSRFESRGYDIALVDELIGIVKAHRLKKRRSRGIIFSGIGAVLLVLAFVITYILHQSGIDTDMVLYGMTTLGITLLFIGMISFMG